MSKHQFTGIAMTMMLSGGTALILGLTAVVWPDQVSEFDRVLGDTLVSHGMTRGLGWVLIGAGVAILSGVLIPVVMPMALATSVIVFVAYGLAQVVLVCLDGLKAGGFFDIQRFEWLVALANLTSWYFYRMFVRGGV